MRIHTDKLTFTEVHLAVLSRDGLYPELASKGSRKRDHAFELGIEAEPGEDEHGLNRSFARNSGTMGAAQGYGQAATWIEWGDILADLFKIDPDAICGPYNGRSDFVIQTQQQAPHRPNREDAERHADRWSEDLFWHGLRLDPQTSNRSSARAIRLGRTFNER